MESFIAIDFGAVSTKVAFWSSGKVELMRLGKNDYSIPTAVCIINEKEADRYQDIEYKNHWWSVGEKAKNQKKTNSLCYAERFKSNLDKADIFNENLNISYSDLVAVVFKYIKNLIDQNPFFCGNRHFALTVPVGTSQNSKRWQAMKEAALTAGLVTSDNCNINLSMVYESVAAGYCFKEEFEIEKLNQGHKKFAIFDFGGSTLDCAYFTIDDGIVSLYSSFPEICTSSFSSGGLYMNEAIIKDIVEKCHLETKIASSKRMMELEVDERTKLFHLIYDVTNTAENIKRSYRCNLDSPYEIEYGKTYYNIDREDIDVLLEPIVKKASKCLRSLVHDNPLDIIIPVGGSSLLPLVENVLKEEFDDIKILRPGNVEERVEASKYFYAVCIGAVNYLRSEYITRMECLELEKKIDEYENKELLCSNYKLSIETKLFDIKSRIVVLERANNNDQLKDLQDEKNSIIQQLEKIERECCILLEEKVNLENAFVRLKHKYSQLFGKKYIILSQNL